MGGFYSVGTSLIHKKRPVDRAVNAYADPTPQVMGRGGLANRSQGACPSVSPTMEEVHECFYCKNNKKRLKLGKRFRSVVSCEKETNSTDTLLKIIEIYFYIVL